MTRAHYSHAGREPSQEPPPPPPRAHTATTTSHHDGGDDRAAAHAEHRAPRGTGGTPRPPPGGQGCPQCVRHRLRQLVCGSRRVRFRPKRFRFCFCSCARRHGRRGGRFQGRRRALPTSPLEAVGAIDRRRRRRRPTSTALARINAFSEAEAGYLQSRDWEQRWAQSSRFRPASRDTRSEFHEVGTSSLPSERWKSFSGL